MDRSQVSASLLCGLLAIPVGASVAAAAAAQPVPVTPGFNAGEFILTPDSSRVVFGKWDVSPGMLYSARTDGVGTPVPLSPLTGGDAYLFNSQISPDGAWIVYNRNENPGGALHVATYASRIDGTQPAVLLNISRVYDDDASQYNVAISPDSRYAVVRADRGDNSFDLISRRIDGSSPPVLLNGEPHSDSGEAVVGYDWTGAAGDRVVFHSRGGASGHGFFTRAFDGSGELVPLSPAEMPGISAVSGDGSTILLVTSPTSETLRFYSNSTAGGALTPLPVDTSPPFGLRGIAISPDGDHGLIINSEFQLLTLPTDGSRAPVPLGPFTNGVSGGPAVISPDSSRIVYAIRDGHHAANGLYVSAIDGSGTPTRLSLAPPPPEDRVVNYGSVVFTNDGRHVVYAGDELAKNVYGLFSVPVDGSRPAVQLTESTNFALTPDGQWVVAARLTNGDSYFDDFVAIPIGGGEPVLLAENPFPTGGIPSWGAHWHLSEDGGTLVFMADNNAGVREIFAVSIPEPGCFVISAGATVLSVTSRMRRRSCGGRNI